MFYVLLAMIISALDQMTKKTVRKRLKPGERIITAKGRAYITNLQNSGAAYGLFSKNPVLLHLLTAVSMLTIIGGYVNIIRSERDNAAYRLSFAMVMGGAVGNIIDRVKRGYVTDFICLPFSKNAPVFNVADFFVALGSAVYLLTQIFSTCKTQDHRI